MLLDWSPALFCQLFLECFVFCEDPSLLDEIELDSISLLLIDLLEEAVLSDWSRALFRLLFLENLILGLVCLLFLEDLVVGQNLSLRRSSGANTSDCALSNADAIFSFIIPDK